MQRIFAFVVVAGLVSGLIGAFAYDQLGSDAGAAPPPPQPQQVREQNLDGSGSIRVHEQGTANVNVVSLPSGPQGRLIELGTQPYCCGLLVQFPLVDVSDCAEVTVMVAASAVLFDPLVMEYQASADGAREVPVVLTGATASAQVMNGVSTASMHDSKITLPFMRVIVGSRSGQSADITAWIWCEP